IRIRFHSLLSSFYGIRWQNVSPLAIHSSRFIRKVCGVILLSRTPDVIVLVCVVSVQTTHSRNMSSEMWELPDEFTENFKLPFYIDDEDKKWIRIPAFTIPGIPKDPDMEALEVYLTGFLGKTLLTRGEDKPSRLEAAYSDGALIIDETKLDMKAKVAPATLERQQITLRIELHKKAVFTHTLSLVYAPKPQATKKRTLDVTGTTQNVPIKKHKPS